MAGRCGRSCPGRCRGGPRRCARRGVPGELRCADADRTQRPRNAQLIRAGARSGRDYASMRVRSALATEDRREELAAEFELRTAESVAESLGHMKGALMKLGQMASYLDQGLPEHVRDALAQLQSDAPPMAVGTGRGGRPRRAGGAPDRALRRVRSGADRQRIDRPGSPCDDPRRPSSCGEGPVPGHRRGHRSRPREHRHVVLRAVDALRRHGSRADRGGTARATGGGTRLPRSRPTTSACSSRPTAVTPTSTCPMWWASSAPGGC